MEQNELAAPFFFFENIKLSHAEKNRAAYSFYRKLLIRFFLFFELKLLIIQR